MSELEATLGHVREHFEQFLALVPRVVAVAPEPTAHDLPREITFRIEFDRAMDSDRRGLSFDKVANAEVTVPSVFDPTEKVFTTTVRFTPGAQVHAWISRGGSGFRTPEGFAAKQEDWTFDIAPDSTE